MHSGVKRADVFLLRKLSLHTSEKEVFNVLNTWTHFEILINSFFTHKSKLRKYLQC